MPFLGKSTLKPLKKKKLSDHVSDELERLIITESLKEGDTLPSERELMEAFNVGRPSVREALQKLSQKGLVEIKSGEKTRITRPNVETVISNVSGLAIGVLSKQAERDQFEQIRQLFEIAVVREAAKVRTEQDIEKLEMVLAENKAQLGDYDSFVETDVKFHISIIECLNNPMASSIYGSFIDWLIKARQKENYFELHEENYQHHCNILDAIKASDPDMAEKYMQEHLKYVFEVTSNN